VAGLGASIKADDGMGLPEPRQRIDKMSFATVAKSQPQHRGITRRAHPAGGLFKQPPPPFADGRGGGVVCMGVGQLEQVRVVLQSADRRSDVLAIKTMAR